MSRRYEYDTSSCGLELATPGDDLGVDSLDEGNYGLVIGNPWSSAYVIEGGLADLLEFTRRVAQLVGEELSKVLADSVSNEQINRPAPEATILVADSDPDFVEAVRQVVDYSWDDEEKDYHLPDNEEGRSGHVFRHLARLRRWLEHADPRRD